jgi:quinol monooxygenase YgiN
VATFLAHIHIHPGREAEFERIAAELHRRTHEREAGVRHYEYWRGAEPSTYYALAAFDSFDAFLVHQSSDHHELAVPSLRDVTASMHLEWLDPVPGACDAVPSAAGPLPEGASELATTYHARFGGDVVAGWWPDRPRPSDPLPD